MLLRLFLVLSTFTFSLSHLALGDWEDPRQGLDFFLKAGRYPGHNVTYECASRRGNLPEIEDLKVAYAGGITNPEINPEFAETLIERRFFYSASQITGANGIKQRKVFDMTDGSVFLDEDHSNVFRGIVCHYEPGAYRYWHQEIPDLFWQRLLGRSGLSGARSSCTSHLDNQWLASIEELEQGYEDGLTDPVRNPKFGAYLLQYPLIVSQSFVSEAKQELWAVDSATGMRAKVPSTGPYIFICINIFN